MLPDEIFKPYVSTKGENGTGIGLYIAQGIIEQKFGGKISARNIENGVEFTIEIPDRLSAEYQKQIMGGVKPSIRFF